MKKVLVISPYFPPANSADMQRVRMSLPYFVENGWLAEIVMVDESYTDISQDPMLLASIPKDVVIHKVKALNKGFTSKLGLGSIALRALWFYRQKVNKLLANGTYHLVYFSTTQFPVCILGSYWKKKFNVPYIIDMQDPWHSDYYKDKPKAQRPKKYWFSYRLNKMLEPIAMKDVGGIISVSDSYTATLKSRYAQIATVPTATITFGAYESDFEIAAAAIAEDESILNGSFVNIVYAGRGGIDMHNAIEPLFLTLQQGLKSDPATYGRIRVYFIGTSYAPAGTGAKTIMPLALNYQLEGVVFEITERISYYNTLNLLKQADGLFIPGSNDPGYTASKLYPYLLTKRPLLAIFNSRSSALGILKEYGAPHVYETETVTQDEINKFLMNTIAGQGPAQYDPVAEQKYSASKMTEEQCKFFNKVISKE